MKLEIDHRFLQKPVVRLHANNESHFVAMCSFLADSSSGHVYFDLIDINNAFTQLASDLTIEKEVKSFDSNQWAQCLAAISPSDSSP